MNEYEFEYEGVMFGYTLDRGEYKPYGLYVIETERDLDTTHGIGILVYEAACEDVINRRAV